MSDDNKPIGWWLKHVDRLLEEAFARLLVSDGLTRREWQLLNAVAADGSAAAIAPFLPEDADERAAQLGALTAGLARRGWLRADGDRLALTADGENARQRLLVAVAEQRRATLDGVAQEEYRATIDVLRRMAGNLAPV